MELELNCTVGGKVVIVTKLTVQAVALRQSKLMQRADRHGEREFPPEFHIWRKGTEELLQ